MNWDWDKLQEKRRRQGYAPKPDAQDKKQPGNGQNGLQNDEQQEEDKRGIWDLNRPGNGGGGGKDNRGGGGNGGGGKLRNPFGESFTFRLPVFKIALGLLFLAWLGSGVFIVDPDEEGIILRFGKFNRQVGPGPHYHLPYPIESVEMPKVRALRMEKIGTKGTEEASMLTGDENIVNVEFSVQYLIKNPEDFLFNVDMLQTRTGQSDTVRNAAIAAMRTVVGGKKIDVILKDDRAQIEADTQELLQSILDSYGAGIVVNSVQMQPVQHPKEVEEAVKDVTSAREDKNRSINEAEVYQNEIIPKTRGEAAEILNKAEAYKVSVVRRAEGEAARFLSMLTEYEKAPEVTRKRLYLEALEEILSSPALEKIIMPQQGAGPIVPYLPLDRLPNTGRAPEKGTK